MAITLFKAVPTKFLNSIKASGLVPMKAGQPSGATARSRGARQPNPRYDKNITWLGSLGLAQDYALGSALEDEDPVILKVAVEPNEVKYENPLAGWYTRLLIPPSRIWFQSEKGDYWVPIVNYSNKAHVYTSDDEHADDDDPAAEELGYESQEGEDQTSYWKRRKT